MNAKTPSTPSMIEKFKQDALMEADLNGYSRGRAEAEQEIQKFKDNAKIVDNAITIYTTTIDRLQAKTAGALQILNEFPGRPSHKWIFNNLDKAEDIEIAFRRIEKWLVRLRLALEGENK